MSWWNLVGQVAGIGANIWNNVQQNQINQQNQAFAQQQATTAFERQKELLQIQNAYNTPAAQMQRYVDAGLNPNLVYGTPNLAASVPSVAPGSPGNAVAPQIDPYQMSQIASVASQSDVNKAKAREILGDTPLSKAQIEDTLAHAENLKTMTDTVAFTAAVNRFKRDLFDDNAGFELADEKGYLRNISLELKEWVYKNAVKSLEAEDSDYELAIKGLQKALLGMDYDNESKKLKNDDLQKWLKVADDIYNASSDEAKLASTLATLDKEFYDNMDFSKDGLNIVFKILTSLVRSITKVYSSPLPKR